MSNKCLMPFIDKSKSFVHGFEAGQIWELAKYGKLFNNYPFHRINEGQITQILRIYGYDYRIEAINSIWSTIWGSNKAELN